MERDRPGGRPRCSLQCSGRTGRRGRQRDPYQPWAAKKKQENAANWLSLDPEIKCYMPGIPRATYMPYPFQTVQTPNTILMADEF